MAVQPEFVSALIGLILTLLIFSYLLGDTPLFKIAAYIFVGVSAGYAAAVAIRLVIIPALFSPFLNGTWTSNPWIVIRLAVMLVLSVLLLMKVSPHLSRLGSIPVGFLVGVGAAVAVGGAVLGTLFPQMGAAIAPFGWMTASQQGRDPLADLIAGGISLVGTIGTLAYFHFGAIASRAGGVQRNWIVESLAWIGRIFIAITLGAIFAGVYAAALTAFIERISALADFFR